MPVERGTQRPRGFGFVTLATREAAENAISKLDQSQMDGRTIRVNESRPKGSRPAGPGGAGGFNASGKEEVKLYVGNLPFSATETEVETAFSEFGTVQSVKLITDRDTGRPRGFGFVEMGSDAEAQAAIDAMHGKDMGGRAMTVNVAKPRENRGGGGGGRGGYGGGDRW